MTASLGSYKIQDLTLRPVYMLRAPVFSYCKRISISGLSTSFGEFRRISRHRQLLLLPIDLIPIYGLKISRGEKHEKKAAYKTGS